MENITVFIRHNDSELDFSTSPDIILGDLLSQISNRDPNFLPAAPVYTAVKGETEKALDLARSLADNDIHDKDVISVAAPGKAG